ncbi:hypothetical protein F2Q69_00032785 [Brassica cretica]|uniref:Uncharacterized protein n=1 Tax=Brassica cretica TaxID=69181 RepID=A0A8S9STI4_BRACR|nr:hypothetical protein F2Q69_00032785 [Brassica cretica]
MHLPDVQTNRAYPLDSLPQEFDPCHLVELNLSYSHLQKLWGGTKNLDMLKTCKLCHSQQLTEVDDLCKAQNIELIDLQGCTKLQRFPATGQLRHLRVVNLSGCTEIRSIPENLDMLKTCKLCYSQQLTEVDDLSKAQNIELIDLHGCTKLQRFPATGQLRHLRVVNLSGCTEIRSNIVELHLQGTGTRELPISLVSPSQEDNLNLDKLTSLAQVIKSAS